MAALRHFTHEHPLGVVSNDDEFNCDGCNTPGAGARYHCQYCLFDLHNECATSPANIPSSHLHPIHQLNLVWEKHQDAAAFFGHRPCNVCGEQVNGLYFTCPVLLCNFVLHPICSKVPQSVRHVIDGQHPLTFQYANESECKICRRNCTAWRYRCGLCRIDIHLECLISPPPLPPPPNSQYPPPTNHDLTKSLSDLGRSSGGINPITNDRRPVDHHRPVQAAGSPFGMQYSSSPSISYDLHHNHSFNCSHHNIPYAGIPFGLPYSSSPNLYRASSSQQYLQPFNNHGDHHGAPGGSQSGSKRKTMYAIVGQILAAVVTQTIIGFIPT